MLPKNYPVLSITLSALVLSLAACEVVPRNKGYKNKQDLPSRQLEKCQPATDTLPVFLSGKSPIYPAQRLMARQQGESIVSLVVDVHGRVKNVEDVKSTHPAFFNHTAAAVDEWTFKPAYHQGKPVEVQCKFRMGYSVR
ncbi:energy transducer TonB [uncultured Pseudoteredinibacter sp.]|uniref:energy transducer TonB n=1 Tax=uncultured Pseudoteredinibacter sp. TaxID=1641701 RepID=UPI0026154EC1|nr:energy transducer TonB [uncultured Pseudoteredinibacter sp.]